MKNEDRSAAVKFSRGITFGVFDGLHPGHQYFLTEALKQRDELIVVVTLDDVVLHFKNRLPKFSLTERMEKIQIFLAEWVKKSNTDLQKIDKKITVVEGDTIGEMGEWAVLKKHQPDVVFVGYDQQGVADEMTRLSVKTITIPAYFPDQYKSSIINQ